MFTRLAIFIFKFHNFSLSPWQTRRYLCIYPHCISQHLLSLKITKKKQISNYLKGQYANQYFSYNSDINHERKNTKHYLTDPIEVGKLLVITKITINQHLYHLKSCSSVDRCSHKCSCSTFLRHTWVKLLIDVRV